MLRLGLLGLPRLIRLFRLYFDFANSISNGTETYAKAETSDV